jgi:hypothetical protein
MFFEEGGLGFHVAFEGIAAWRPSVTRRVPELHCVCVRIGRGQTVG